MPRDQGEHGAITMALIQTPVKTDSSFHGLQPALSLPIMVLTENNHALLGPRTEPKEQKLVTKPQHSTLRCSQHWVDTS